MLTLMYTLLQFLTLHNSARNQASMKYGGYAIDLRLHSLEVWNTWLRYFRDGVFHILLRFT
jgi:hypothetical protein